mgnify:CR=1 FL=1
MIYTFNNELNKVCVSCFSRLNLLKIIIYKFCILSLAEVLGEIMLRKMPFILVMVVVSFWILDPFIPVLLKEIFFSVSLTLKQFILFLLPFLIFFLLFKASAQLAKNATWIAVSIIFLVCCSNFLAAFLAHYVGDIAYSLVDKMPLLDSESSIKPLWSIDLPSIVSNDKAMFAGILSGILFKIFTPKFFDSISPFIEKYLQSFFTFFSYIVPLFILGFMIKMQSDGLISFVMAHYGLIFLITFTVLLFYIFLYYFVAQKCSFYQTIMSLKNMTPAAISAFSTMSSAATMPLTIAGVESNGVNKKISGFAIPTTANIHLIGDCFAIPIFAYTVLKSFNCPVPSLSDYLIFCSFFVLAKFSVAAVPAGGILVMLPILQIYLGFNAEMMSLITSLYILFDPLITCANVLGNGAFALVINRLFGKKVDASTL